MRNQLPLFRLGTDPRNPFRVKELKGVVGGCASSVSRKTKKEPYFVNYLDLYVPDDGKLCTVKKG